MFYAIVAVVCGALITPTGAFSVGKACSSRTHSAALMSTATAVKPIVQQESPDFYWQFRLDRLASKKGGELAFSAKNYPDCQGSRAQYDAYYLDLTLQGKMENFDWAAEKEVNDSEWQQIYKYICNWTSTVSKTTKMDTNSLPTNDFDLLTQFYPSVDMRGLEAPFSPSEVGANFPYANMKQMLGAAAEGKLNIPGFQGTTSLDTSDAQAKVTALKTSTMAKLDAIHADALSFAKNALPDETAKKHYQELRAQLATFPQSPAEWSKFRANFENEVDEMARLAGKKEDEHHGHHDEHDDSHMTPAKEFEMKYGRNLDEMQERFNRYKTDPQGFLEASILEKFGSAGLSVWKKSQEFSSTMSSMSEADKSSTEKAFADFLKQA
eukprot:gene5583-11253_t